MSSFNHTLLWRRLDSPGHDICWLQQSTTGWQVSGTAIFLFDQMPCCLTYEVRVNTSWQTYAAKVSGYVGKSAVVLAIALTPAKLWSLNGIETEEVTGCIDLDLGFTPATNLIAIRRLALNVGEQASAPAAWLDFPDCKLKQLEQHYHRISNYEYAYTAPDVGYAATLEVNHYGAIVRYPDLWEQEVGVNSLE